MFRNGIQVTPIRGGHVPVKVFQEDQWISLKDVADQGMYIYDIELFRPDSTGVPPSIVLVIRDLKNPKKPRCMELPAATVAQAWNDFEFFYTAQRPEAQFRRADPMQAKSRKSAASAGFMKDDCTWAKQASY